MKTNLEKIKWVIENDYPEKISNETGINKVSIHNYKKGESPLNRMPLENAEKLISYYDRLQATNVILKDPLGFKEFTMRLGLWFNEAIDDQKDSYNSDEGFEDDLKIAKVVEALSNETLTNIQLLDKLYEVYKKNE